MTRDERRNIGGETSFAIGGRKFEPFAYWRCAHDWAGGFRVGDLFVRIGNNGRGVQEGRPGWLIDITITVGTARPGS